MTTYPAEFQAHLLHDCTTVCVAWRLTRRDGHVSGYTDHDRALTIDGGIFEPNSGFGASEAAQSLGFAVDTVDIDGALSSNGLIEEEIAAGFYDDATIETLLVNWRAPEQFALIRTATIARITRRDGRFLAELKSRMHALDQPHARYLTRACDAELGDGRCGVDLGQPGFSGSGAVIGTTAPSAYAVSGVAAFEAGWFAHGVLTWTSGPRSSRTERVVEHRKSGGAVELRLLPIAGADPEVGATFTIVAGCDKAFGTCKAKFGNQVNFRGFPHLPGNDSAYAYVTDGLVFDGAPLMP
jgi:uncharacterized phage protein (TIGR02218 family)